LSQKTATQELDIGKKLTYKVQGKKMNSKKELKEMLHDSEKMNEQIKTHLSKFNDLNLFLKKAEKEVKTYFDNQDKFKTIENFKEYLKKTIGFYVHSFSLSREEKIILEDELNLINETYDKLIYFSEYNPVEALKEKRK
jgi:hypothetical protein